MCTEQQKHFAVSEGYRVLNVERPHRFMCAYQSFFAHPPNFNASQKLQANGIYNCKRQTNNPQFPHSIKICSTNQNQFAFIPNDLSKHLCSLIDYFPARKLICFVVNYTTHSHANAIFMLFELESAAMDTSEDLAFILHK